MADEPRRSGRATKGQHTKNTDVPEDAPLLKRKGKSQAKAKQVSTDPALPAEEDEYIRCICGEYEEEEDVERDMICCDQCTAWQHNDCMEVTDVPENYYCEQCRPDLHKDLLAKVAKGEKPWEERAKEREREAEQKTRKKKGGKRGRKSARQSDIKPEVGEGVNGSGAPAREAPMAEDKSPIKPIPVPTRPGSGQKRKAEEHDGTNRAEQSKKARKASTPGSKEPDAKNGVSPTEQRRSGVMAAPSRQVSKSESGQTDPVESPADLVNDSRRKAAAALVKLFVDQATSARNSLQLPEGETVQSLGLKLGIGVEHAMYQNLCGGTGNPNQDYNQQFRTISFNVKKNPALRDRLLLGSLSPSALSTMNTEDMASKELQQMTAQMKKDADKQHVLVQETGPRIRRTHKGDELVTDETHHVSESIFPTNQRRRRESILDDEIPTATSPRSVSPRSPGIGGHGNGPSAKPKPHAIDTQAPPQPGAGTERKSSSAFNIQDVWSSIQSPDTDRQPASRKPSGAFREPPLSANIQPDAEIDQLLKDEDAESEPYSPREFSEEGILWHGKISMSPVAEFSGYAKFAGGANLSSKISWNQLLPSTLPIDGRIDISSASKYLCGLQYSQTTDISVVSISIPDHAADRANFDKLFSYFVDRKRYGVIGKHPLPAVKDTYIIPVETGEGTKPDFLSLLENNAIEDPNPERLILVAFVIKSKDSAAENATPRQADSAAPTIGSPTSAVHGSPALNQPSHFSPVPGYNGQGSPAQPIAYMSPAQHQAHYTSPIQPYQPLPLIGAAAAAHVLGPMAKAPAVEQLLIQVPNAGVPEFNVVRDVLINVPQAANDLGLLTSVLEGKRNGG